MSDIPYLGLRPYQEVDQHNFYGRDADCEILVDKLLANRLTLLFAASGVGKSSLLNAAVLPRLKDPLGENLSVVYHNDWVQKPLALLHTAIREAVPAAKEAPADHTLAELLSFCTLFTRHPFVVVLDQFEEFFRYQRGKDDFDLIIQQITALVINPDIPVSIVISMREDFALELNAFKPKLPILLFENFYRLERMKQAAARDAIVRPAELFGYSYEPALLERLIHDLSSHSRQQIRLPHLSNTKDDEYVEPAYLQIVCSYLWELNKNDPERCIRLASYKKSGGSNGIVQRFLDDVQESFSIAEKGLASKAFDYLVAQGGVKMAYPAHVLAKILNVEEAKLTRVLDKLANEKIRILRSQPREGVIWYELYHDMFSPSIERWNTNWKSERFKRLRLIVGSLTILVFAGVAFLVESFIWTQLNNFPLEELFARQKHQLMQWGVLPEPLPVKEMVGIVKPTTVVSMGESDFQLFQDMEGMEDMMNNYGHPVVELKINNSFELSKFEITYKQFDYFVWSSKATKEVQVEYPIGVFGTNKRGDHAVTNVSWNDARLYTKWLSKKTGDNYRLPTEAEWEYAARAGTTNGYWWAIHGDDDAFSVDRSKARCRDCDGDNKTVSIVGSYDHNQYGLFDTAGNVWEWTCSEHSKLFDGREQFCATTDYQFMVVRGGSWNVDIGLIRSSVRDKKHSNDSESDIGFRVLREVVNQ